MIDNRPEPRFAKVTASEASRGSKRKRTSVVTESEQSQKSPKLEQLALRPDEKLQGYGGFKFLVLPSGQHIPLLQKVKV